MAVVVVIAAVVVIASVAVGNGDSAGVAVISIVGSTVG